MRVVVTCVLFICVNALASANGAPVIDSGSVVAEPAGSVPSASDREGSTWLGVQFTPRSTTIKHVFAAGPAAQARLRVGDRVIAVGGVAIKTAPDVTRVIDQHKAGDRVDVVVERDATQITATVTIAVRPTAADAQRAQLVGKRAPDVKLATLDGKSVQLADLKGKVVVLDFWATWCAPCVKVLPQLNAWHRELGAKGLVVIGVTQEDAADVRAFIADGTTVEYPIALDGSSEVLRNYRVQGLPLTVIIDKTGVVRFAEFGQLGTLKTAILDLMK